MQNLQIKNLEVSPAPHIRGSYSLKKMMWITAAALLLPASGGIYFFGLRALILIITCSLSAVFFEAACQYLRREKVSVTDGSALITGMILSLIIPTSFPLWAAVLGTAFSICVVKQIFGGFGKNIFNPALMGRAFLTAAFPVLITTYTIQSRDLPAAAAASERTAVEAVTQATPLGAVKFEDHNYKTDNFVRFFLGAKKGSMGETSGILILTGLVILLVTKVADWRLPLSYFFTVFVFSGLLWIVSPERYMDPVITLVVGGILLGGTYMVTDPVTTPVTAAGKWIFGGGAGMLTIVIRNWSGYPEGVMFSIILMNCVTPLINRYLRPRSYGA
ncbi:MAG: RnfABCDGE type electron transport complex subunit D [Elusimicrobiota bacterium]